ncbi:Ca2+-binding RTX toxin-like protein [Microvirga lupini]|uniref:Ca2+-binding RTX toxin-like protein n=1 Tax=Microvirga lupini TaxID=420324 RepID=A0A7W4VKV6_9HYPH|nr:calcium-binding protein [Microvirga lupini]MBB3018615.1 Ca2+-binding RTX toxin-like protein [Microvirga lupini]
MGTIIRFGHEQRVNIETRHEHTQQSVTGLADGGWLITWTSDQDDAYGNVYQQRYDKDGTAVWASDQQVNEEPASTQYESSVTGLVGGGWVVTWSSYGQDGSLYGVYQRYYDENGIPKDEQKVNTEPFDVQYQPSVTALTTGGWVVTWTSVEQDGSWEGVYQQCYDANGDPVRGEQRVNFNTTDTQFESSVTALPDGEWLVTWTSVDRDGSRENIYQRRYNADGTPKTDEQRVNTEPASRQMTPSVTVLADGGWIVTWSSLDPDGAGWDIYQRHYDKDGIPDEKGEQPVNSEKAGDQTQPSVTALADGGWIVTWQSKDQDGSGNGVYQQRYDEDGNPVGGEQQVNVYETGAQFAPSVTGLSEGGWLVAWTSTGQDGSVSGVYQRHYMSVTAFGAGQEHGTGTEGGDTFQVRNGGLTEGDSLEAGGGIDTLQMIEAGTLDLTAPDVLTGIDIVFGSDGNDTIVVDESLMAAIGEFQGGDGTDALHLKGGDYDLSTKLLSGFETFILRAAGSLIFADKSRALLVGSQTKNGAITVNDGTFSAAERQQLYKQGIRKATDEGGAHILEQAQASLSVQAVTENTSTGSVVATLSVIDPNPRDGLRVELTDNAGGRFALSGNQLVVADGSLLDYETGTSHRIAVRIVDEGGITTDAAFTITLNDIPVEIIRGTSRADVLKGGSGQDRLYGGLGKDTLTGGLGQDIFAFDTKANTKTNRDKIVDFSVKDDTIWLDNKVFAKLGKAGSEKKPTQLKKDFFTIGSKAKDKNDYIIYDNKKGVLFYDADGSGTKYKQVEIATLSKKLKMTHKDFFVI